MEMNQRRHAGAPEQVADILDRSIIVALTVKGEFDAEVRALKEATAALENAQNVARTVAQAEAYGAEQRSKVDAELIERRAEKDRLEESVNEMRAAANEAKTVRNAEIAETHRLADEILAAARSDADQARKVAAQEVLSQRVAKDAMAREAAELSAVVKTARGELESFREQLAQERAKAAKSLGLSVA